MPNKSRFTINLNILPYTQKDRRIDSSYYWRFGYNQLLRKHPTTWQLFKQDLLSNQFPTRCGHPIDIYTDLQVITPEWVGFLPIKLNYSMADLSSFHQSRIMYYAQNWCLYIHDVVLQGAIWTYHLVPHKHTIPLNSEPKTLARILILFLCAKSAFLHILYQDNFGHNLHCELDKLDFWNFKAN